MLVLTRRPGEAILIGDATIKVVGVQGHRVKLGITAPDDVPITRLEVAGQRGDQRNVPEPQEAAAR